MILEEVKARSGATVCIADDCAVRDKSEAERIIAEQNSLVSRMMHRRFKATAQAREDIEYGGCNDMV